MADTCRVLTMSGTSGRTPATIRHAGSPQDKLRPAPPSLWAARDEKLVQKRADAATLRERAAENDAKVVDAADAP